MTKQIVPTPVRLPADLKEWLKSQAAVNLRSLNHEILARLMKTRQQQEIQSTSAGE